MTQLKRCAGCGEDKPLEAFSPAKRGKFGRAFYCRVCAAARRREHYARTSDDASRAVAAQRSRDYRNSHPEYAAADRARATQWAKNNAAVVNARNAAWRKANPDRACESSARYRAAHPEVGQANVERRRARMLTGAAGLTTAEWRAILDDFNHACGYCLATGVPLQQEHMQPLSRGGLHTRDNVIPACGPCNQKKGTRTLLETLQVLDLTDEGAAA